MQELFGLNTIIKLLMNTQKTKYKSLFCTIFFIN